MYNFLDNSVSSASLNASFQEAIAAGILPPSAVQAATSNPFAATQAAPRLSGPPKAPVANQNWIKF